MKRLVFLLLLVGCGSSGSTAPCAGFDLNVPTPKIADPHIAFADDRYFVVTSDQQTLTVAPIIDGQLGPSMTVGPIAQNFGSAHGMAWSGSRLGITDVTSSAASAATAQFVVYDRTGVELFRHDLPTDAHWFRTVWASDRFVVFGQAISDHDMLAIAELDANGVLLSPPYKVGSTFNVGWIGWPAFSPTAYVVPVGGLQDPSVMVVDRATHAETTQLIDSEGGFVTGAAAYHDHIFMATRSGGSLSGDPVQFYDATGVPGRRTSMIYTSNDVKLFGTPSGYSAIAMIGQGTSTYEVMEVDLDANGDPLAPPVMSVGTATVQDSISVLDGAVADGRFAVAFWSDGSLHAIEHCY